MDESVAEDLDEGIKLEMIKDRLEAVREAVQRTRLAHIAITTASLAVASTAYNAYLSRYRTLMLLDPGRFQTAAGESLRRLMIDKSVQAHWLSVSTLGFQVGVGDLSLFASIGLLAIATWFYFAARRENRVIAYLLIDTRGYHNRMKLMTLRGITGRQVFITISGGDRAIESLDDSTRDDFMQKPVQSLADTIEKADQTRPAGEEPQTPVLNALSKTFSFYASRKAHNTRASLKIFSKLPSATLLFLASTDMCALFWTQPPFRVDHRALWHAIDTFEQVKAVIILTFTVGMAVYLWTLAHYIDKYRSGTEKILTEYWGTIKPIPELRHDKGRQ